ncbi:unnamed protein product [marine sediment metagenome]|uniref:Uncharacterized protein n=1 Tax=marine sediment metagenome TaxID=412755 RepID=X1DFB1_9ZZZZ
MQRYKCSNCNKVFCGWAVKYKLKYKCPVCGGELRVIPSNKKNTGKVEGYHKEAPEVYSGAILKIYAHRP